jgi:hypothetical protein
MPVCFLIDDDPDHQAIFKPAPEQPAYPVRRMAAKGGLERGPKSGCINPVTALFNNVLAGNTQ